MIHHTLSPEIADLNLEKFMREALLEADAAGRAGELPIGAVAVLDGRIIGRGRARHQEFRNQIRHAELSAILDSETALFTEYKRAILFTTVEPCPMCLGAVVMADIPHVIFALHDQVVQSRITLEANPYVRRHIRSYYGGVLEAESARVFGIYKPNELRYIETGGW